MYCFLTMLYILQILSFETYGLNVIYDFLGCLTKTKSFISRATFKFALFFFLTWLCVESKRFFNCTFLVALADVADGVGSGATNVDERTFTTRDVVNHSRHAPLGRGLKW